MVAEYYYNPNTNKTFTKDSAQKIAVPEGFSSITEDVYQGLDQSKLVPLLVKALQELEARVATLEKA